MDVMNTEALTTPGTVMAVPVRLGADIGFGNPAPVVKGPYAVSVAARSYDVSADGQRFLLIKDEPPTEGQKMAAQIHVAVNWFEELKAKASTK